MKRLPVVYATDRSGHDYWRSLGERARSDEFREALAREFPEGASEADTEEVDSAQGGMSRRRALSLMGAAFALAGLTSCRRPEATILPYARPPEEIVPGKPLHYTTAVSLYGTAFGLLVESHEGRPTKLEGNPKHPESLGATTTYLQAMILDLYDPDRSHGPSESGEGRSWSDAAAMLQELGRKARADGGRSLAVVTEAHRSPTLARVLADLRASLPAASVVRYEPFDRGEAREGARIAMGRPLEAVYDFAQAKVVVALDADPLGHEGSPIKAARAWARGRTSDATANRLYAIESAFSVTGANADHRFRCESGAIPNVLCAIAHELAEKHGLDVDLSLRTAIAANAQAKPMPADEAWARRIRVMAKDLASRRGSSLIVVGARQPRAVHALAYLLNQALGNVGRTLRFVRPFDEGKEGAPALAELARDLRSGAIRHVVLLGTNAVFDAPSDTEFADALKKAETSVHLASHFDETSASTRWHLNRAHPLESWSDVVAEDGTASVAQPTIAPLWDGKTDAEVVALLLGRAESDHQLVRATWQARLGALDFEQAWRVALHDGIVRGQQYPEEVVSAHAESVARALGARPRPTGSYEVVFLPDSHAHDGRFANNGWLQELPDPITKLTWGNAAWLSSAAAKELGVQDGDRIALTPGAPGARGVELPIVIVPGQADKTITVMVGQGRRFESRVARGVGVDTYALRRTEAPYLDSGISVRKASGNTPIARTQEHFVMEGRPLAREGTVAEYAKNPHFVQHMVETPKLEGIFESPNDYRQGHKWGMTIDLDKCTGCNACMVACQAENNVPIVGVDRVLRSREMHWLRVDRYFEGSVEDPTTIAQPVACQQCENAPCESVCPVGATVHSPEGLNDMVYNRCVGTRYCANNCPYKVRRFNFFEYSRGLPETRRMQFNPDVTVRSRGVMEKCTFCVQRINKAKIEAKKQGAEQIADGTITSACEQACPTQAIVFGDLNDPNSRVAKHHADPRTYRMLEELNVKPRLSYMAKIRNPHPELES